MVLTFAPDELLSELYIEVEVYEKLLILSFFVIMESLHL